MALEYIIRKYRPNNEAGLDMALRSLPSSRELAELYWSLFNEICGEDNDWLHEDKIRCALETLAVARRPLTQEELAYAVFMSTENPGFTTMASMHELTKAIDIIKVMRPLIRITETGNKATEQVRLVHQSLKELILRAAPSDWTSKNPRKSPQEQDAQMAKRRIELDGTLFKSCVRYLLLDECNQRSIHEKKLILLACLD